MLTYTVAPIMLIIITNTDILPINTEPNINPVIYLKVNKIMSIVNKPLSM